MATEGKVHPDCINALNPYHECVDYCYTKIAEAKARAEEEKQDRERFVASRTVHPECINASNPYHECTEYCYSRIAKLRAPAADDSGQSSDDEQHAQNVSSEDKQHAQNVTAEGIPILTEKQAKMDKLEKLLKGAREANLQAVMDEKQKLEAPSKPRGISKKEWLEERKEKLGKLLKANGLDISKAYMLDTQEAAEAKYKKWEKDPAPFGWDVFNQKTLYKAHKERTKNIECDMEAYTKAKEADPEFYREASSLQYGKVPKVPEENVDRMVKELRDREAKRKNFSRRRKFHDEKDIDSINDRNEHFNKKIERFFGKYTAEIKNNLERGTALPD